MFFLPRSYGFSLLSCNQTMSPILNDLFFLCWSCCSLYHSCDFFSVSCTCKWIYLIFSTNLSTFNATHTMYSPSLLLVIHIQNPMEKATNTENKFWKVTYQWKYGLLYYKSVEYKYNFHPKLLDADDCNFSKVDWKSYWLLLSSHLCVDGVL